MKNPQLSTRLPFKYALARMQMSLERMDRNLAKLTQEAINDQDTLSVAVNGATIDPSDSVNDEMAAQSTEHYALGNCASEKTA